MNQVMLHDTEKGGPGANLYLAKSLGAPFKVYLADGVEIVTEPSTNKEITKIKDLPGLLAAVVQARVLHTRKLSGQDLKFIRSALQLKAQAVASALDLTPEHYSRCETGPRTMSAATEKLYRMQIFITSFTKDWHVRDAVKRSKRDTPSKGDQIKAEKMLSAFHTVFFDMKLNTVYNAEEEIAFVFSRHKPTDEEASPPSEDNEDTEWKNQCEPKTASCGR